MNFHRGLNVKKALSIGIKEYSIKLWKEIDAVKLEIFCDKCDPKWNLHIFCELTGIWTLYIEDPKTENKNLIFPIRSSQSDNLKILKEIHIINLLKKL